MIAALKNILLLMVIVLTYFSCQKEISFEGGNRLNISTGTLQADGTGDCLPKTVSGTYIVAASLTATHSLSVQINAAETGVYRIFTDTVNGYSFSASGSFTTTGIQTVTLTGSGMPIAEGDNIFHVKYSGNNCAVTINVLPAGTTQAEFSLQGAGGNCLAAVVNGNYTSNTSLIGTNTVVISANVIIAGNYSVSTTATNGMSFSASGNFINTGLQTITLQGSGTPVNAEATTISISASGSTCSFVVNVIAPSAFDYFPRTAGSNWTYEIDDNSLDTARFFVVPSQLTANGNTYNIFMVSRDNVSDTSGYYRKSASDYSRYMDLGDFIGFDLPQWGEYVFLKDNIAVGANWNSAAFTGTVTIAGVSTQTVIVRFNSSILQKDVPVSVVTSLGTVDYTNVIVVEEKYEQSIAGNWVDITSQVGSFRKYYARDIGLIKYEAFNGAGDINAYFELRRYEVF